MFWVSFVCGGLFLKYNLIPNVSALLQVSLATVIFVSSQKALSPEIKTVIKQQLENASNGWTAYRIARQASRMVGENKYLFWCCWKDPSDFLELEKECKEGK